MANLAHEGTVKGRNAVDGVLVNRTIDVGKPTVGRLLLNNLGLHAVVVDKKQHQLGRFVGEKTLKDTRKLLLVRLRAVHERVRVLGVVGRGRVELAVLLSLPLLAVRNVRKRCIAFDGANRGHLQNEEREKAHSKNQAHSKEDGFCVSVIEEK